MESNKELPKITMLDVMAMLEQSWSALPDTTVINCSKKFRISKERQQDSIQDTDDPFAQLSEMLDELRALDPNLAPGSLTVETFIDTDDIVNVREHTFMITFKPYENFRTFMKI